MVELNKTLEDAAQMLASGEFTFLEIAEKLAITRRTLQNWRKDPAFIERVHEIVEEYKVEVRARGIAVRENRVAAYNDRWRKLESVIEARANDPAMKNVPGGETGLIVVTKWERIPSATEDEPPTLVPVHEFDASLFKEIRELEKQAAMDLGQWTEKREVTGQGATISVSIEAAIEKIYGQAKNSPLANDSFSSSDESEDEEPSL